MSSTKKRYHTISKPKNLMYPQKVIFVDCETKPKSLDENTIEHCFWFGVAYYKDYKSKKTEEEFVFSSVSSFWDWVLTKTSCNQKLYIIAHNSDFDFRVLNGFSELIGRGWFLNKFITEAGRFILDFGTIPKGEMKAQLIGRGEKLPSRKYIYVLDTLNWFKWPLWKMGEIIGVPKTTMPSYEDPFSQWVDYCRNDVYVLRKSFENFIVFLREHELGTFGHTLAKQAFNAFRYKYMNHQIHIHTDKRANDLERESYYGGRTECFYIGEQKQGTFYKLDINSMYPHAMATNDFPVEWRKTSKYALPETIKHFRDTGLIIANVDVETDIPCVPKKHNGKLCFPVGKFNTTLCQPELELLDRLNIRYSIKNVSLYRKAPIFRDYALEMYKLRYEYKDKGNKMYEEFIKLLMNSLYGKFGQRHMEWVYSHHETTDNFYSYSVHLPEQGKDVTFKCIGGHVFVEDKEIDGYDTFVAVCSFVTSYARVYLWDLLSVAGIENCYYCDTDSIFCNEEGYERLTPYLDNRELGKLKLEETAKYLHIRNLKDYMFGEKEKIKGINKKGKQVDVDTFQVEQWEHFNGALRKGHAESVITKTIVKHLQREYGKGTILANGRVVPFVFEEF